MRLPILFFLACSLTSGAALAAKGADSRKAHIASTLAREEQIGGWQVRIRGNRFVAGAKLPGAAAPAGKAIHIHANGMIVDGVVRSNIDYTPRLGDDGQLRVRWGAKGSTARWTPPATQAP